jgi:hypothetical protein
MQALQQRAEVQVSAEPTTPWRLEERLTESRVAHEDLSNELAGALAQGTHAQRAQLARAILDRPHFASLRTPLDQPLNGLAALTLMNLGYPWALELSPEELDAARRLAPGKSRFPTNALLGATVLVGGWVGLGAFNRAFSPLESTLPTLVAPACLTAAMAALLALLGTRSRPRKWAQGALWLAGSFLVFAPFLARLLTVHDFWNLSVTRMLAHGQWLPALLALASAASLRAVDPRDG